jgi:hypothetical protein
MSLSPDGFGVGQSLFDCDNATREARGEEAEMLKSLVSRRG